ncbi:MAG: restriction endonuclease [Candidatus Binataceae bacterium]|nr:restriction endonuclease [Candidatus Binataceae bacterium]
MPAYDRMMWPTLQALREIGGSASKQEVLARVTQIMRLPEEIQNVPHNDGSQTEVEYRLSWARYYLRKVDAIGDSERGVWTVTPKGRNLTEEEVAKIPAQVKKMFPKKPVAAKQGQPESEAGEDDESWQEQLLSILQSLAPASFERLSQRILRESGFVKVEVTGKSGDGGIDGIGVLRLNLLSFQVFFQCKRYRGSVGSADIRNFRGAMVGRTDKGLLITTGRFTPDAQIESTRDGAPPIDLIDGLRLCELLKDLQLGVETKKIEQVTIRPEAFNEF